jgi:dTDP-4-amino-4,6-dideoxygalactose transaminase
VSVSQSIAFIDIAAQRRRLGDRVERAIGRVLDHGHFIMGPEVAELEAALARFGGVRHCVSCASGTDALLLVLMAKGVSAGDAVLCPSFTFAATAEVVALVGATPVFVDVLEDSFNLDPVSLEAGVTTARRQGLRPVGVIPVDLFGQPADYDAIATIAAAENLWVLADAAQSFGAHSNDRPVGSLAAVTTTSFFPAKPLGCYGDGGAIFTDDGDLVATLKSLRVHGQGTHKYDNARIGLSARLDTIQAAVLLEKLAIFPEEIVSRERVAALYDEALADVVMVPRLTAGATSVWAQYTIRCADRDAVAARLKEAGIPTAIYYPKAVHQQTAYRHYPVAGNGTPVSERLARESLSLPMHAYLDATTQARICEAVRRAATAK